MLFGASARAWESIGRQGPRWAAEAARALSASWVAPEAVGLDVGVAWARRRDLPLLEARLRLARGLCAARSDARAGVRDLGLAQDLADGVGARLLSGRIRWLRCGAGIAERDELERATVELEGDEGWWARAALALADVLGEVEPGRALTLASGAHARFVSLGLVERQQEALAVMGRLSVLAGTS